MERWREGTRRGREREERSWECDRQEVMEVDGDTEKEGGRERWKERQHARIDSVRISGININPRDANAP